MKETKSFPIWKATPRNSLRSCAFSEKRSWAQNCFFPGYREKPPSTEESSLLKSLFFGYRFVRNRSFLSQAAVAVNRDSNISVAFGSASLAGLFLQRKKLVPAAQKGAMGTSSRFLSDGVYRRATQLDSQICMKEIFVSFLCRQRN